MLFELNIRSMTPVLCLCTGHEVQTQGQGGNNKDRKVEITVIELHRSHQNEWAGC